MATVREERSLGELLRELSTETSDLLRKEVELAKTEAAEKASFALGRVGEIAMGGGIALMGGLVLLAAAVTGLTALLDTFMSTELAAFVAPLLLGGVLAFVGWSKIQKALNLIRSEGIAPRLTTQTLQENKIWLKEKIQ
jgi:hypothetical protein